MLKFTADYIFPGNSSPIKNGVVLLDKSGRVKDLIDPKKMEMSQEGVRKFQGVICPGFVNTHCHLELSYLKGKIQEKRHLVGFIKDLISVREKASREERIDAIVKAEQEMIANGIVAVGDISNGDSTFSTKEKSRLNYHTFIEVFGSDPAVAENNFNTAKNLYAQYHDKSNVSITAHATYSVRDKLANLINKHCMENISLFSVHNQETESENLFFKEGKGDLFDFFRGISNTPFQPTGKNALPSFLSKFTGLHKILLVHNTFTREEDIIWANTFSKSIYWVFCPNANLYIEDRQPNYALFLANRDRCSIGTDSLASNWRLSILDELKTITRHTNSIDLETLIRWGTYNGAKLLNFDNDLGSIEKGKMPGINLIENVDMELLRLTDASKIKVLA